MLGLNMFSSRLISLLAAVFLLPANAYAQMETNAQYAFLVDFDTGTVLLNKNGDEAMHPSSMSKLMTSYVVYDQLKQGKITLSDTLPVSEKAWKMGGSKMFVHVGDNVSVEDLIRGVVVQSGNDACIVLAEGIAGSEEAFATMMNETGAKLGLTKSHFVNATGWPDEGHVMSSRDLATLSGHLIRDFPEDYKFYGESSFTYNGITQPNRNRLLGSTLGVDGLKTGHTEVAGYGITLSAKDAVTGRRVILVINGLESDDARVEEGAKLLAYGLKAFENKTLVKEYDVVTTAPVWFGNKERVGLMAASDLKATLPKAAKSKATFKVEFKSPIPAPIKKGQEVATLTVTSEGQEPVKMPLVAAEDVGPARGLDWIKALFTQYLAHRV